MRRGLLVAAAAGALAVAAVLFLILRPAPHHRRLIVGVDEDGMKWYPFKQAQTGPNLRRLGLDAVRVTLRWAPGEVAPPGATVVALRRAVDATRGHRLVLAVYSRADRTPQTDRLRRQYCRYVGSLLERAPAVQDVVIWNEPNSNTFWRPQFGAGGKSVAPQAYERLLARCWDDLHRVRPGVNVIAASASHGNDDPAAARPSHSPARFYEELARAYRASGRDRPIFDTVGHNPYPSTSAEPPWAKHAGGTIGEGDYAKLVDVLTRGFGGTAQPVPGRGLSIWYMEDGFQTRVPPARRGDYRGRETDRWALPAVATGRRSLASRRAVDQATQLGDALRLAWCQPYVGAFFNFLLADEESLTGWQSGLLWADWTPKPSYAAFRGAVADVAHGRVDCSALRE